jgi:membrane carboxypeptidase/penicillin-binding protein PbpC
MSGSQNLSGPAAAKPTVVSPRPGTEVLIDDQNPAIPLKSEGAVGLVYWYFDEQFLETAESWSAVVIQPGIGPHKVSLMDSRGLTAKSEFMVIGEETLMETKDAPMLVFD